MKTKQLRSTKTITSALFAAAMLFSSASVFAQVKIGSNPTTITPNANLDVEGIGNTHSVVMKSGKAGIGTAAPLSTLHVQAVESEEVPTISSNIVARFDPFGGQNASSSASILVNGGRAIFGYELSGGSGKYAFLRGNSATDVRLQTRTSGTLDSNAFVMSSEPSSLGFIGLNTSVPQSKLDVRGTTKILASNGLQTGGIWNGTSNINGFEAVAVTGTGDAYVGMQRSGVGAPLYLSKPAGAVTGQALLIFQVSGLPVGSISYNGTGVSYNVASDQRLKENIRATKFGLEALKTVKVYDYNFKTDPGEVLSTGVLAQELHKLYPQAVKVGGADERTDPWQVDYSKLVPMLVKSVQELSQTVESLNQKVNSLETDKAQLSAKLNERIDKLERLLSTGENSKSVSSTSPLPGSVGK